MRRINISKSGFTIVELIIVIVVIGILAVVAVASYSAVMKNVNENIVSSDLIDAFSKFKKYYFDHGTYPASLSSDNCPLDSALSSDNKYCLDISTGASLTYNNGDRSFSLIETKNGIKYEITDSLVPFNVTGIPIISVGAITGTLEVSQTLTAGVILPTEATVSYQWQSGGAAGGVYTNISGATGSTYVVSPRVMNKNIRLVVTGTGDYGGVQSVATTSAIANNPNWLTIGTQTWAKANQNNGDMVIGAATQTNNSILEKRCFNDVEASCTSYGGLYQWNEAMQYVETEKAQGICPPGSHIPSDSEWTALVSYLGSANAGTILKTSGSSGLDIPSTSGFLSSSGAFSNLTPSGGGFLWSSSGGGPIAWRRVLSNSLIYVQRGSGTKTDSYSVRCMGN